MILQLASRHGRKIAGFFVVVFYSTLALPAIAFGNRGVPVRSSLFGGNPAFNGSTVNSPVISNSKYVPEVVANRPVDNKPGKRVQKNFTGGPSQPEMSSFKSIGTDNMVNLFTGGFSYNIPLMDVGGYPVNIYYDGGITPEQEASWVGLGWNINPGNVNRNARGVPDDFSGQDTLIQVQKMKPNKTWGFSVGADIELLGLKGVLQDSMNFSLSVGASLGVAFNNYLGPSLDFGLRGSAGYKISGIAGTEKLTLNPSVNIGIDINSRSGTSFSGGVSLAASTNFKTNTITFGTGLSTGYNSRAGLKALQTYEQVSFSTSHANKKGENINWGNLSLPLHSNIISFLKPSYTPYLRMPVTNTAWSGRFQLGLGSFGVAGDVEAEVYGQKSEINKTDTIQKKPMVGYLYYQNAVNNANYVTDFTRFNDREVTPNTPVISVPQYSYDVFSIQGEGTGGSIRAYRNDLGYVRDNITTSKDKNLSIGVDVDPPGHYGANVHSIKTPSTIGEWNNGNLLRSVIPFTQANGTFENVYFRNPAENCVIDSARYAQVGGTDLVRFVLGGTNTSPTIEPKLQAFNKSLAPSPTLIDLRGNSILPVRNKRSQVTNFLTAEETAAAGLDKVIKNYNNQQFLDNVTDTLLYEVIPRVGGIRKPGHLSQFNVTESNGKRYVYGIPVYNITQKDFTFSVNSGYVDIPDKVPADGNLASANSSLLNDNSNRDGYVQITTTPAYAHSFLLSGILSPDFVDVTGNGITDDDLGNAVKFNYTRIKNGTEIAHRWRTPLTNGDSANFNAGNRSEVKDDKGIISYGERESWYLQSIESKTMIALFCVSNRSDGQGAASERGGINASENLIKKLDSIVLYSKADLKANGLANAKAIKVVHFVYKYLLCQNTPDNPGGTSGNKGKLTLESIYATYGGKTRAFKNQYHFYYNSTGSDNPTDNPNYAFASSDRWGNYKPQSLNPGGIKNGDYPYSYQPPGSKTVADQNASAWMLKKIVLPSGGQMELSYESDDYAFVQNKRASTMMQIVGFNNSSNFSTASDKLYKFEFGASPECDYVFINIPVACNNATEVYNRYLQGVSQLAFKLSVQMPKGSEYITCYTGFNGNDSVTGYGVNSSNHNIIWVKMKRLGGKSPLSITALEYLRQQLPGQAFKGYDVSGEPALKQVADMLVGMLISLRDAFTDPVNAFRRDGKAMHTDLAKSFVRLNDPDGYKYGGGHRVKSVTLKDNWNTMTGQFTASYGQKYDYTTTENFNGAVRKISSGVASYEPSIGGEENPFQSIIEVEDYLPLGPTSYGAVEMPVLDAFFPAPVVGYSKVTVSSIKPDSVGNKKNRSAIGRQVTEFYTAKDYPVYYSYTPFDASSVKEFHQNSTTNLFNKYAYDFKAQSQGFLIATNDMHGQMKSKSSYAANDSASRISYSENIYRNTGVNGLNDKFSFISKESGGGVYSGNMGVDVELMTDTREFSVKSSSREYQGQVDIFYFAIPIPVPTIWPIDGVADNIYRSVTTTKVISYHSVLDSVVVIDKGSMVSTKNMAYDANTGVVLVSRSNNEFNKPVYTTSYPAYWAYGGMGLAWKNIDATYSGINFSGGRITNPGFDLSAFESGDELIIKSAAIPGSGCESTLVSGSNAVIWVFDKNKSNTSLITTPDLMFVDSRGRPYTMSSVNFRIIRSGHRNMLDAKAAEIISMVNPLVTGKLFLDTSSKVINASAIEFKEKWQTDNDVIQKLKVVNDPLTCTVKEVEDSLGYLDKSINLYLKGLLGNFHAFRNMVFYDGRKEYDTNDTTNISENGFLKNFKPYWNFDVSNNLVPDTLNTQWVWNTKLNKVNAKGMELETIDALGIYTSAQYGYDKSLPVAIASNARYNEMFAEGFEDYGYGASLNNTYFNLRKRHIDLGKMTNSFLVNTDSAGFKAHSGKYVLGVNGTGNLTIPLAPDVSSFSTVMAPNAPLPTVVQGPLGGEFTSFQSGANFDNTNSTFSQGNILGGVWYTLQPRLPVSSLPGGNQVGYTYLVSTKTYFQVPANGTYTLKFRSGSGKETTTYSNFPAFASIWVLDSANNIGTAGTDLGTTSDTYSKTKTRSFCLNKGLYILYLQFYASYSYTCSPGPYTSFCTTGGSDAYLVADTYSAMDSNTPSWNSIQFFKTYTTVTNCTYTKPIPATDSMMNAVFSVKPGKKMMFSAWVRETCGNAANGIPCKEYTYTHNQVQLKFTGNPADDVTLSPSGPIIDGWQRYEGEFTAPPGSTVLSINLVNSMGSAIYFDDIRIHPFNSNMKSYVYDPVNLRLTAELDANNYASLYEYDEEGILIRTKVETREGIKTMTETRRSLQKVIQ